MTKPKFWCGPAPKTCDCCAGPIDSAFVDGRTYMGAWATMCLKCHKRDGVGLGIGSGQKFEKQDNGQWLKTA